LTVAVLAVTQCTPLGLLAFSADRSIFSFVDIDRLDIAERFMMICYPKILPTEMIDW
jgi:hypothetical protein